MRGLRIYAQTTEVIVPMRADALNTRTDSLRHAGIIKWLVIGL